jgi:hypothetical protein
VEPDREPIRPADVHSWGNLTAPARVGSEGREHRAESVDHASRICRWPVLVRRQCQLHLWLPTSIVAGAGSDPAGSRPPLELRDADRGTLRYRIWHIPARLARHARQRTLAISPQWPWKDAFLTCWQRLCALPASA